VIMLHRGPGPPLEVLIGEPSGAGYDRLRICVSSQSEDPVLGEAAGSADVDEAPSLGKADHLGSASQQRGELLR